MHRICVYTIRCKFPVQTETNHTQRNSLFCVASTPFVDGIACHSWVVVPNREEDRDCQVPGDRFVVPRSSRSLFRFLALGRTISLNSIKPRGKRFFPSFSRRPKPLRFFVIYFRYCRRNDILSWIEKPTIAWSRRTKKPEHRRRKETDREIDPDDLRRMTRRWETVQERSVHSRDTSSVIIDDTAESLSWKLILCFLFLDNEKEVRV